MKANGSLLWLYLLMHSNSSQKLSEEHGPIRSKCIKCSGLRLFHCSCFTYTLTQCHTSLSGDILEKEATLPKLTGALDYNALQVLYYRCKVRDGLTVLQIHSYEGTTSATKNYHGIFNLKKHCDDKLTSSEFQSIQSRDRSVSS